MVAAKVCLPVAPVTFVAANELPSTGRPMEHLLGHQAWRAEEAVEGVHVGLCRCLLRLVPVFGNGENDKKRSVFYHSRLHIR
jgi:hypothetical protein